MSPPHHDRHLHRARSPAEKRQGDPVSTREEVRIVDKTSSLLLFWPAPPYPRSGAGVWSPPLSRGDSTLMTHLQRSYWRWSSHHSQQIWNLQLQTKLYCTDRSDQISAHSTSGVVKIMPEHSVSLPGLPGLVLNHHEVFKLNWMNLSSVDLLLFGQLSS